MSDEILLREDDGPVSTLTLNAPGSLNALSDGMLAALTSELTTLAEDRQPAGDRPARGRAGLLRRP